MNKVMGIVANAPAIAPLKREVIFALDLPQQRL
jgi:hypothetical protein